ncbi:MAG TPA: M1 family aminopeptidase [Verrucomicrobiae bacterium]|nr:M1 family aminopeptidase [Verrucomicrobiae bacterium]
MQSRCLLLAVLILGGIATVLQAEESITEAACFKTSAFFAPPDSPEYRKYVADRAIKVLNLAIDVTPDFTNRTIAGKTKITFEPIAVPLAELSLDAVDLRVSSLKSSEKVLDYQVTDEKIIVTFAEAIPPAKSAWVEIEHSAEPSQGIYFRTPEMGYKPGDTHLFSQGEEIEARHWYPCPDAPNQKFTSEVTCRVPEGMTAISNGRKVSETKDPATGLVAFAWKQEKPHANYLITLTAGYFQKVEDRYRDIPLAFYTPPSDINEAENSFRDTKDMMGFFEKEIGVPYPWAKYDQVVVNDFVAGGMENTSATTLTDSTLFTDATENIRSSEGLVAHELAHQWFGDYVTCKDWSHVWLNEGFATYYAQLYGGHKHGRDALLYSLYGTARGIVGRTNVKATVERRYDNARELFSYLAYDKGAWVLHMLRSQLGDDLYRQCVKTYLERNQYGSVVTEDFNRVIEELSGRGFDQFFDQWVYHAGQPELDISYAWDTRTKLARISVRQTQRIGDDVMLFKFPLNVRFKTKSGVEDRQLLVSQTAEDFYFALNEAPMGVRIDPELTLLARLRFEPPSAMLDAQLEDSKDVVGRLLAVETLGKRRDKESVAKLKKALNSDKFYGVRIEAAKALRSIHNDDALEALLASTEQSDARVREQVIGAIGGFFHTKAYAAVTDLLKKEKNPDIQAEAIDELGAYPNSEVREILLRFLNTASYRNGLAASAIRAMRAANDPSYIEPLLQNLRTNEAAYPSRSFATALDTLASLSHDRDDRVDATREFLLGYVNHPRRSVRVGAINALGTLEDPRAVAVLTKFNTAQRNSPEQTAAANAIRRINSAPRVSDGVGDLRSTVLQLQKENSELRKDFKALEKKFEALAAPQPDAKKKAAPVAKSPKAKSN